MRYHTLCIEAFKISHNSGHYPKRLLFCYNKKHFDHIFMYTKLLTREAAFVILL